MARRISFLLTLLLSLLPFRPAATQDFVKEYDSVYGHIIIQRRGAIVEMFATYKGWMARESGINLEDPLQIIVPYVKYLFAGSVVRPDPTKVLLIGLGGGGFNRLFGAVYPEATLDSVEIDQKVLDLAKEHMGFQATERNRVHVRDGRSFLRRSQDTYDWIILDAFHGSVVPPHLKTLDFYREIAAKLTPGGVLIANIHQGSELFYFDIATFRAAFTDVVMLQVPGTGNVITLAANEPPGTLENRLKSFDPASISSPAWHREINAAEFPGAVLQFNDAALNRGRVMTDDFAPAEYYKILPAPTLPPPSLQR